MGKLSSGRPSQAAHRDNTPIRESIAKGRASRAADIAKTLATIPGPKFDQHSATRRKTYPHKLRPWHHALLIGLLENRSPKEMGERLNKSGQRVSAVMNSPIFKQVFDTIIQKRYESIAEGEHGVVAQARLEAPHATVRLVNLSKTAKSESVKLDAIKHVLALAGAAPVVRTETYSLDKLLTEMDRRELEVFSQTGRVPRRLAEMLAQQGRSIPFADESEPIDVTPTEKPIVDPPIDPIEDEDDEDLDFDDENEEDASA